MAASVDIPEGMNAERLRKLADVLDTYETLLQQYFSMLLKTGRIMPHEHDNAIKILSGTEAQEDLRRWAGHIDGVKA